nr:RNA-directed DNA polymerase, eukaryota [Tanacetum cinerariifolium]
VGGLTLGGGVALFGLGGFTLGGGVTYAGVGGLTLGGVTYSGLGGLTLGGGVALFGPGGFTLGGGVTYAGVGGHTLGGVTYFGLGGLTLRGGVALFGLGGFTLGGGAYFGLEGLTLRSSLNGYGVSFLMIIPCGFRFCVKDVRCLLDDVFLPKAEVPTRMLRIFFKCDMAKDVMFLVSRWWDLEDRRFGSFQEWLAWFNSIRLGAKSKGVLEGVFYISWWSIWNFRNLLLFEVKKPRKDVILMI